ncbi:CoA pyrophosphatase [Robertkochia solimangrovi]|uniref:NUDIX hydrolase n=1 Tax=Robertkochia solimangrovi TaxID=2213046 RepID=UPI0030D611F3
MALPGAESHYKMAPEQRIQALEALNVDRDSMRKAAVLSLFYPDLTGDTNLLLILRKTYKGVHSNQVGFPGGKEEPEDPDLMYTALRETQEEVGVAPTDISVIRPISEIYIPPSNFLVTPFMGFSGKFLKFIPDEVEVEEILEVRLSALLDERNIGSHDYKTSYAGKIAVPVFKLNDFNVWGATAMMLNEVKDIILRAT